MMNCNDIRQSLYVFLDGEFDAPEELAFLAHVEHCGHCSAMLYREKVFLSAYHQNLPIVPSPEGLEARIRLAIKGENAQSPISPGKKLWDSQRFWGTLAAVLMLVPSWFIWDALSYPPMEEGESLAYEVMTTHLQPPPRERQGQARDVQQFLTQHVSFPVDLPRFSDPQVALIGARLTEVGGREAVLLHYQIQGEKVSILQMPIDSQRRQFAEVPRIIRKNGYNTAIFRRSNTVNSVVTRVPANLERVIHASWKPGM